MWHVRIALASVLILVSLCLAYDDAVDDRSWIAKIYKTTIFETVLKCYGIVIDFRAVLVHRDCGNSLKPGETEATITGKRVKIPMIVRPMTPNYHSTMLILAKPVPINEGNPSFDSDLSRDGFKKSDCTLVSGKGERFDENADVDTKVHVATRENTSETNPSLIYAKNDNNNNTYCQTSHFLLCPQIDLSQSGKVLVGIAGYNPAHYNNESNSTCVTTFAMIANDLTWVERTNVGELWRGFRSYQKVGVLNISPDYLDTLKIEVSSESQVTYTNNLFTKTLRD